MTIKTTHVGSLPRPSSLAHLNRPTENPLLLAESVEDVMVRQMRAGLDIINDGEYQRPSYITYVRDRLTGFMGPQEDVVIADLDAVPDYGRRFDIKAGGVFARPACIDAIRYVGQEPMAQELGTVAVTAKRLGAGEIFFSAASPGAIALLFGNEYYGRYEDYLEALVRAMQVEYEEIVQAGFTLQLDCPDLAMGSHVRRKSALSIPYTAMAEMHVEAINQSTRSIPKDRMRMHVCWGNYPGPHHHDIPLREIFPFIAAARPRQILFEASNPRHAGEWSDFPSVLLEDKVIVPGFIDTTSNFVEHPESIAQRIERFVNTCGIGRVVAGTDCGFSSFAAAPLVHADIAWLKIDALVKGAAIAAKKFRTSGVTP